MANSLWDELFDADRFTSQFMFDSEYQQRRDITDVSGEVELQRTKIEDLRRQVAMEQGRSDRLELAFEALFTYLENQELINRETFGVIMREIDRADGKLDGKISSR